MIDNYYSPTTAAGYSNCIHRKCVTAYTVGVYFSWHLGHGPSLEWEVRDDLKLAFNYWYTKATVVVCVETAIRKKLQPMRKRPTMAKRIIFLGLTK